MYVTNQSFESDLVSQNSFGQLLILNCLPFYHFIQKAVEIGYPE